jgi:hypothetical protein
MFAPAFDELLLLADIAPPEVVLSKMIYHYPPDVLEKMDRILIIAGQELCPGSPSEQFLHEHLFGTTLKTLVPVLERLVELKKIKPINVTDISQLLAYFNMGVALFNRTSIKIGLEQWQSCQETLFLLIKYPDDKPYDIHPDAKPYDINPDDNSTSVHHVINHTDIHRDDNQEVTDSLPESNMTGDG